MKKKHLSLVAVEEAQLYKYLRDINNDTTLCIGYYEATDIYINKNTLQRRKKYCI